MRLSRRAFQVLPFILLSRSNGSPAAVIKSFTPSLPNLLSLTHHFEATNPRDYIYALLGILPEDNRDRTSIPQDYRASVSNVFTRLAKHFIKSTGTLNALSAIPPLAACVTIEGVPSWVPDWSVKDPFLYGWASIAFTEFSPHRAIASLAQRFPPTYEPEEQQNEIKENELDKPTFNASLGEISPYPFEFDRLGYDEILRGRGVVVDNVISIGAPMDLHRVPPGEQEARDHLDQLFQSWKTICDASAETIYPPTGQSRKEAFWRTILVDRYWKKSKFITRNDDVKRLPKNLSGIPMYEIFGRENPYPASFPPETTNDEDMIKLYLPHEFGQRVLYNGVSCHCIWYSAFRTRGGYMGLCQPNVRPGDLVVVLFGGTVPFVLRKFKGRYVLLGEW